MCPATRDQLVEPISDDATHRAERRLSISLVPISGHVEVNEATSAVNSDHNVPRADVPMEDSTIIQILYRWGMFNGRD